MEMDKNLVRMHFDRHAHEYDQYASVQAYMADKLMELLGPVRATRVNRILEIGSGTGLLTRRIRSSYPQAQLTVIDLSASMLQTLRNKLGSDGADIEFILGDAEASAILKKLFVSTELYGKYDLIVSSAAFQWLNDPASAIRGYLSLLEGSGVCAFATFGPQTFHELKGSFFAVEKELGLPHIPHGQTFRSGKEWGSYFPQHNQVGFHWREEQWTQYFLSVKQFLLSVKKVGASNANASDPREQSNRMGKRIFDGMQNWYEREYANEHGIPATYDLSFAVYQS
jgi:malonyl-CoA O-methyltransferase